MYRVIKSKSNLNINFTIDDVHDVAMRVLEQYGHGYDYEYEVSDISGSETFMIFQPDVSSYLVDISQYDNADPSDPYYIWTKNDWGRYENYADLESFERFCKGMLNSSQQIRDEYEENYTSNA